MKLIEPCQEYLQSYYEACSETWGLVHDDYIIHNPQEFEHWKTHIFEDYENQKKGIGLRKGFVPSITFWVVDEAKYIGTVNIRLELSEELIEYGGNCGFMIRKSMRRKGLGVVILKLSIKKMNELNISPIVLTAEEKNAASWKIIEKSNYKKRDLYSIVLNGKLTEARRYYL